LRISVYGIFSKFEPVGRVGGILMTVALDSVIRWLFLVVFYLVLIQHGESKKNKPGYPICPK
jgi:hypothetical protein